MDSAKEVNVHDDYFDLGSYSRPITTSSKDTQRWFDRGLIWAYSFNHNEALTTLPVQSPTGVLRSHLAQTITRLGSFLIKKT